MCDGATPSRVLEVPDAFLNHAGQPHHRTSRMVADMQGVLRVVRGSERAAAVTVELDALEATLTTSSLASGAGRGAGGAGTSVGARGAAAGGAALALPLVHALVAAAASRCHYVVACTALDVLATVERDASVAAVTSAAALLSSLDSRVRKWASACSTRQLATTRVSAAGAAPAETASLFLDARGAVAAAAALLAFRVKQLQQQRLPAVISGGAGGDAASDDAYRKAVAELTHDGVCVALGKVGESGKSALYVSLDGGGKLAVEKAEVLVNLGVQIVGRPPPVRGFRVINNTGKVLTYALTRKDGSGSAATATGAVFRATPEAGAVPVNGSCSVGFTCAATAAGDHELLYSLELSDRVTAERVDIRVTLSVCSVDVAVGVPSVGGELAMPSLDFGVIVSTDLARRSVTVFNPLPLPLKMKAVVQPVSGSSGRFGLDRAVDQVGARPRVCACVRVFPPVLEVSLRFLS